MKFLTVQHTVQKNRDSKTYDANKSAYSGGIIAGGYMRAGDKILNTAAGKITLESDNLEGTDRDLLRAKSVLAALGFKLPKSENGVYWAKLPGGFDGYTVIWKGLLQDQIAFSLLNSNFKGVNVNTPSFEQFIATVWHEVKGHNVDDAQHNSRQEQAAFDAKYEKPISEAIKKAKANGTWRKIVADAEEAYP